MGNKVYKKVALVILDGFGVATANRGNAIAKASMPVLNDIISNFPSLTLQASGPLVGLPWGEMGNSEVGHLNIGAGRIVGQDLPRITNAIQSGEFFKNEVLRGAIEHSKKNNSSLHILGLLSSGGVHSLDEHIYALLGMSAEMEQRKVFIHMFTDGRDTDPKVALDALVSLEDRIQRIGVGKVATVTGRFYAMDRGGHWNQTMMTYRALVEGEGEMAVSAEDCVRKNYSQQIFDEMIKPTVILNEDNQPVAKVSNDDAVVFINFRQDRAVQLTQAFVEPSVLPEDLRPGRSLQNLYFATMTQYKKDLPVKVVFPHMELKDGLAELISKNNLTQFHIAESEKYAHVTAFFNCGVAEKFPGEERVIVRSPEENTKNYVDHPEMSAEKLTDILVEKITKTETNFFVANYANPDMVGHTGNLQAAVEAVEFVDKCLKKLMDACLAADAVLIITADHGNVEQMVNNKTGDVNKDHTTNPVPLLVIANEFKYHSQAEKTYVSLSAVVPAGVVGDIAPTILALYGIEQPESMTGISLLNIIEKQLDV
ncbi:MAG: 2,3-bisphosphoglycerate-independent phosphoglycerate mutase [Candidatus Doudnabacteria bacterium CG10_big_fil_rev_8_21_14_0_10_42_18]|uniref:2,3-bisphosphoglycerate-independent phosphoglycerate mutase n=1 Tax=Candidatus Doudnabacteria bacterium CG10_big_fil_rev_8_21_14_0_10_42_18 TaxID=1974552 RepID=A0A2H0VBB0_9BACT|nr:MAG: 2,3-bisphosphoglycerate-independent phosphoglycerate mutase [Candidatus Doudnabacteria bacterium CG10_big_fil_rev_8_21_14_0_10_42_18]